jgi:hypothetical protein
MTRMTPAPVAAARAALLVYVHWEAVGMKGGASVACDGGGAAGERSTAIPSVTFSCSGPVAVYMPGTKTLTCYMSYR